MNIVDAIRKLCEEKNGFRNLFNKALSYEKLCSLVDDKKDAELFATLIYGKARRILLMLIQDTYNYKKHAIQVEAFLQADGLSAADGLCGKTDEDNLGFTYAELDRYIRTGEIEDQKKKERIDYLHKKNLFKLKLMPVFEPDIPSALKL